MPTDMPWLAWLMLHLAYLAGVRNRLSTLLALEGPDMTYDASEPHDTGMLEVGDGQTIYWEVCGNPDGKPAVVLHGGPGSGCTPAYRTFFDPDRYRVVLFDQRGCGRSTPHAGDPDSDLSANTTAHLLRDIERLREHLSIDAWLVFGLSWGSTLALAYSQQHVERVTEIVIGLVVTSSRREIRWVTRDVGRLTPAAWQRFRDHVPSEGRDGNLADAYARLLDSHDPNVRSRAADAWCEWEDTHVALLDPRPTTPRFNDPRQRLAFCSDRDALLAERWLPRGRATRGQHSSPGEHPGRARARPTRHQLATRHPLETAPALAKE